MPGARGHRPASGDPFSSWPPGSLLARLPPEPRAELMGLGRERVFAAGSRLMSDGEQSSFVTIILEGHVKVSVDSADGRPTLLAVRVAGDLLGELACLDDQPRMATVTASGAVRVRVIGCEDFRAFLRRHPDAAVVVSSVVAAKLRWTTRRRVDVSAYPVLVRLARLLIDLAEAHGRQTSEGIELRLPLTQTELAALIGASEPAVHRALTALRRGHVMTTGYRHAVITNVEELRSLASSRD